MALTRDTFNLFKHSRVCTCIGSFCMKRKSLPIADCLPPPPQEKLIYPVAFHGKQKQYRQHRQTKTRGKKGRVTNTHSIPSWRPLVHNHSIFSWKNPHGIKLLYYLLYLEFHWLPDNAILGRPFFLKKTWLQFPLIAISQKKKFSRRQKNSTFPFSFKIAQKLLMLFWISFFITSYLTFPGF